MSSSKSKTSMVSSKRRLLFDRRYGWVIDDWRDPSEEALAGGRGMFCLLPLAKSLLHKASQSVHLATSSAVKVLERPELLQTQAFQTGLSDPLHKLMTFMQKPGFKFPTINGKFPWQSTASSLHIEGSNHEL